MGASLFLYFGGKEMEEEAQAKNSVLDELYSLRAGLSVISEGKDQIIQSGKKADKTYHDYVKDFSKKNRDSFESQILDVYSDKVQARIDADERKFKAPALIEEMIETGNFDMKPTEQKEVWNRQQKEGMVALWDGGRIFRRTI